MPKYYVKSGKVRDVIDCPSMTDAAYAVVMSRVLREDGSYRPADFLRRLSLVTTVSEQGYNSRNAEFFPTHFIISLQGPFAKFDKSEGGA